MASSPSCTSSQIDRRVVPITGASQGIGRAISLRLACDGFDIALSDLSSNALNLEDVAQEIRKTNAGRMVCLIHADLTVEQLGAFAVVSHLFPSNQSHSDVEDYFKVVANAGIIHVASLIETSSDDLDRLFAINVRGGFLVYKYAAQKMIVERNG